MTADAARAPTEKRVRGLSHFHSLACADSILDFCGPREVRGLRLSHNNAKMGQSYAREQGKSSLTSSEPLPATFLDGLRQVQIPFFWPQLACTPSETIGLPNRLIRIGKSRSLNPTGSDQPKNAIWRRHQELLDAQPLLGRKQLYCSLIAKINRCPQSPFPSCQRCLTIPTEPTYYNTS